MGVRGIWEVNVCSVISLITKTHFQHVNTFGRVVQTPILARLMRETVTEMTSALETWDVGLATAGLCIQAILIAAKKKVDNLWSGKPISFSWPFISFSFSYVMFTFFSIFKTEGFQFAFPSEIKKWRFSLDIWCFWSLTASKTSKVKNNYAHVIMQDICTKFIEVNFCVGCIVSQPNRL